MEIKGLPGLGIPPIAPGAIEQPPAGEVKFSEMLGDALKEVHTLQQDANNKVESFVKGGEGTSPHEAMIALEKADIAFQLMAQVKAKIIRAYEEVMRMQV